MEKIYNIEVCCPNCAAKMETATQKVEGVSSAAVMPEVLKVCRKVERDVEIKF